MAKFSVTVPGTEYRASPLETAIWESYGLLHEQAVAHVGADMAFSLFASRLTREMRRHLGTAAAKAAFVAIAESMEKAAEYDVEEPRNG